ncbi:MAG: hypothetical protein DMG38_19055 [Acidobacteria bacterium]|nr:MAG: hypothetical protein DMG38_19055 [Acidobacteriota bacterium]
MNRLAVTLRKTWIVGGRMAWSSGDSRGRPAQSAAAPALPRICVGYLLGIATLVAEMVAISLRPELAKQPPLIPPLYLFPANFIALLVGASRSTARPAAFFLISRSKENKCREQFVGRCCFVG